MPDVEEKTGWNRILVRNGNHDGIGIRMESESGWNLSLGGIGMGVESESG